MVVNPITDNNFTPFDAVFCIAFTTQVYCRNTSIYCTRSLVKKGVWWEGTYWWSFTSCFYGPIWSPNIQQYCSLTTIRNYRLQMFGLVGLPCMWCWLGLILLKTLKTQETSGKQFRLVAALTQVNDPINTILPLTCFNSKMGYLTNGSGFLVSTTRFQITFEFPRNVSIFYLGFL